MAELTTRPATLDDLKKLIESLNEVGAPYLLVGGYALFVHGLHRMTEDIDILVPATVQTGEKVRKALLILPDQAAKDIDPEWFVEAGNIRVADEILVDVLQNAGGETYDSLVQYAQEIDLDGIRIRTLDLEGLLKTKMLSNRGKDNDDRNRIQAALNFLRDQRKD
jgi:predicted nucleotidyltransferase